jgi:hypothetical protein
MSRQGEVGVFAEVEGFVEEDIAHGGSALEEERRHHGGAERVRDLEVALLLEPTVAAADSALIEAGDGENVVIGMILEPGLDIGYQGGRVPAVIVGEGDQCAGGGAESCVAGGGDAARLHAHVLDIELAASAVNDGQEPVVEVLIDDYDFHGRMVLHDERVQQMLKLCGASSRGANQADTRHSLLDHGSLGDV